MKYLYCFFFAALILVAKVNGDDEKGKHLFILSGQSNMAGLNPSTTFTPAVEKEFGKENVIVIKDALGGQPISRWYRKDAKNGGDLYQRLMKKVHEAIKDQKIQTLTFIWMQGERDAREKRGETYADNLKGLIQQLRDELKRPDVNFVIGRISDFDMENKKYQHWTLVRDAQVKVAEGDKLGAWIDTDDLNDGKSRQGREIKNDLHMSAKGYDTMGERFAAKAIELINKK